MLSICSPNHIPNAERGFLAVFSDSYGTKAIFMRSLGYEILTPRLADWSFARALKTAHHRVLHFNADILIRWGADYGLKTLAGEWWRPLSATFLHTGLGHLAGNMFFLLLIAPVVERLLGPIRFAMVYLFAGIGAALLGLGWFPAQPSCGASGAINGLFGAFLGCYLRGVRTIPARIFLRSVGLLLLYALVTLLLDYLEHETAFIVHVGGLLFGFAGGLLFGHVLGRRTTRRKVLVFSLVTTFHWSPFSLLWPALCTWSQQVGVGAMRAPLI
jgi:membrane associated rhomboid family serine protease